MDTAMDQLSLPFRIALLAVLAMAAMWLVVLKPHGGPATASTPAPAAAAAKAPAQAKAPAPAKAKPAGHGPTAPGVAGLSRAVQHARDVAAGKPVSDPTPAGSTTPAAAPAVTAAGAHAAPPVFHPTKVRPAHHAKPVAAHRRRSTLLLFAGAGADDRVAREVVRSLRARGVRTIIAPLSHLDAYQALIGNVDITTSPTLLVIGPTLRTREIVGLPDRAWVQQALRATRR